MSLAAERYAVAAVLVATCVLFTARAADPVNVIKLTALLLGSVFLLATWSWQIARHRVTTLPWGVPACAALALLAALCVSALVPTHSALSILGAPGRNSGLLAYGAGMLLFLLGWRLVTPPHTRVLVGGVVFAGLFTSTYGFLQRVGLDAVPWNNPFNPIIAALGNPNFASGYLGVAAAVAVGGALWRGWGTGWRALCAATASLCLLAAALSASVQGPIAAAAGLSVVGLAWTLDAQPRTRRLGLAVLAATTAAGVGVLVAGLAAKVGPATAIFSDVGSVSRVYYWDAAVRMFLDNPMLGVGLDQFGNHWREARSLESVHRLGGRSYTDAAHSVPLQMLAQGGVLLGLAYSAFVGTVLWRLVAGLRALSGDARMLLGTVGGGWAAYQVQSIVSIDQVPLLVLHFSLAAAVVAVARPDSLKQVRLPGAPVPPKIHPNDARARRRARTAETPPARVLRVPDLVLLSLVTVTALVAAWYALTPLRANAMIASGDRVLQAGDANAALDSYEEAAALLPWDSLHWRKQADLLAKVEEPARARAAWTEAFRHNPYEIGTLTNAGSLAEEAGDIEAAERFYSRLYEVDPLNPESLLAASAFDLRHRNARRALETLERVVPQLPANAFLLANLGDARAVLGDPIRAREAYEEALVLQPDLKQALEGLKKLDAAAAG